MDRPIPYDLTAERATLGAILLDREAIVSVAACLSDADWYLEQHALVYAAMLACYRRREPPDLATVAAELRRHDHLDLVGGLSLLVSLSNEVPSAAHVEHYAGIVRAAAIRRRLIVTGGQISAEGYDQARPLGETLSIAEKSLFAVTRQADTGRAWRTMGDIIDEIYSDVERSQSEGAPDGLATGYPDLDEAITCLFPDQLTILAARPAVGKTAMLLSLMDSLAAQRHHVGAFSAEMGDKSLGHRAIAMYSGVETRRLRSGRPLPESSLAAVMGAMGTLRERAMSINDTPGITLYELASQARRLHTARPMACLFVDYLQLVRDPTAAREKRYLEVASVARGLKDLARELHIHVIALAQISRDAEDRPPVLSDMRESGEIEQAADNIWGLYRPPERQGITELHIIKHREGPLTRVDFRFDSRTTRFHSLAQRHREGMGHAA